MIAKVISEGELIPKGYGIAWPLFYSREFVCYPFPLNHIIAGIRTFYLKIRDARINTHDEISGLKTDVDRLVKALAYRELNGRNK